MAPRDSSSSLPDSSQYSLRFKLRSVELGFLSSRIDSLLGRAKILTLIGMLVLLSGLLSNVFMRGYLDRSSFTSEIAFESSRMSVYISVGLLALLMMAFISTYVAERFWRSNPAVFEWLIISIFVFLLWSSVLVTPFYLTRYRGYDAKAVHPPHSDAVTLLMIDGLVTLAQIGLPLRWCALFPLGIIGVVTYGSLVFIGASGEDLSTGIFCLGWLIAIVTAGSLSKRSHEVGERKVWTDLLNEKSLRCKAEFRLSNAPGDSESKAKLKPIPQDGKSEPQSQTESVPHTTATGQIFNSLYESHESVSAQLASIAMMGDAEHWRIKNEEVTVMQSEVLGEGGFGVVTKGIFSGIRAPLCDSATHGAIVNPAEQQIMLVLELVDGVTLTGFMKSCVRDAQSILLPRVQVMVGVCRALLYMHTRRPHIIHGDLKGNNIMVQISGAMAHPKLLDFGLSRVATRNSRRLGGTLAWVAPEVLKGSPAKCSADVYSFGRVIVYVVTGSSLEDQLDPAALRSAMRQARPPAPIWPPNCTFEPSCKPLARACLDVDEEARPRIGQVYRRLLEVPQEMCLVDPYGDFLSQLSFLAAHWQEGAQEGREGEEGTGASVLDRDSVEEDLLGGFTLESVEEDLLGGFTEESLLAESFAAESFAGDAQLDTLPENSEYLGGGGSLQDLRVDGNVRSL